MRRRLLVFPYIAMVMAALLADVIVPAYGGPEPPSAVPLEDYALYDQVVAKKFLTSQTRLVIFLRMTIPRLLPNQDYPATPALFDELGLFGGRLPAELIHDFVAVNQEPSRLEGRFGFGVRYRFVSGNAEEEPEVRAALPVRGIPAWRAHAGSVLERLAFSRVGRTRRNDQALVYVEQQRPSGSGAGLLVWFHRTGTDWNIHDTDVVWTARTLDPEERSPLAP